MLSLSGDQLDAAHEQVFGYKASNGGAPQPPSAGVTTRVTRQPPPGRPPQRPQRPPRPSARKALRPQAPPPVRIVEMSSLYQRQPPRRRLVLSEKKAVTQSAGSKGSFMQRASPSASREDEAPPEVAAAAVTKSSSSSDSDSDDDTSDVVSSESEISNSPLLLSGTRSGKSEKDKETSGKGGNNSEAQKLSQMSAYYTKTSRPSSAQPSSGTRRPVPPATPPTRPRPSSAAPRLTPPAPRANHTSPPAALSPATPPPLPPRPASAGVGGVGARSGTSAAVFDRLAGEAACGAATLGKRVLQWARGAGLALHPPPAPWSALHLYATAPLQHGHRWRRACAKARHQIAVFARGRLGHGGARGTTSAEGSREHSTTRPPKHSDPLRASPSRHSARCTPRGRPASATSGPLSTPGGLRAYRCREGYKRWCYWQLCHFYELGSTYLTCVWRVGPASTRGPHHSAGSGGGGNVSAAGVLGSVFDGRYKVPSASSIHAAMEEYKEDNGRARVLLRLLKRENAADAHAAPSPDSYGGEGGHRGDTSNSPDSDASGAEDDEADADVYRTINESRRSSQATADTEPYFEVRLDSATGLLHLSFYVNGDEGGSGAEFVGSSVAACLDNARWVILKGLWVRHVLFFHFHRTSPSWGDGSAGSPTRRHGGEAANGNGDNGGDAFEFDEHEEQRVSHRSREVDGFVLNGIAFEKTPVDSAAGSGRDAFVCSRCGQVRRSCNAAYISKTTGRLVRGHYYCALCDCRTRHLLLPPTENLQGHVMDALAAAQRPGTTDTDRSVCAATPVSARAGTSPVARMPVSPSYKNVLPSPTPSRGSLRVAAESVLQSDSDAVTVHAVREWARAAAVAPRPAWQPINCGNSGRLFGQPRGLDCPPPRSF